MTKEPLQIRSFGLIKNQPLHSSPATKQADYMLNLYFEGSGYYQHNSAIRKIEKGLVALYLPEDKGMIYSDQDKPYSHYFCRFNGQYAYHIVNRIIESNGSNFFYTANFSEVLLIMNRMNKYIRKDYLDRMDLEDALFLRILFLLEKVEKKNRLDKENLVLDFLNECLHKPIVVSEMEKNIGLSYRQINRLSHEYFDCPIIKKHELMRIELASNLLKLSDLKIKEIAVRTGFSNELYFSKVFKKIFGLSPKYWRRQHHQD